MGIDIDLLSKELRRDEGLRDMIYLCSENKQSIGYGINLETTKMPERVAALWLNWRIRRPKQID